MALGLTACSGDVVHGFVDDFDKELPPALLHQFRFRQSGGHFHAHFWIDIDDEEAMRIQRVLNFLPPAPLMFFSPSPPSARIGFLRPRVNRDSPAPRGAA